MKLISAAFVDGGKLPSKYTCNGQSISPPVEWQNAPANTKSFALIYDDPDATTGDGVWDHWVLYNIPPTINSLPENIAALPHGAKVGFNSWSCAEYGAPCPPSGEHRYIFHLYALDVMLDLAEPVTSKILRDAMEGRVLATTTLTGLYQRKKVPI